jgi:diguanylate cyclase (GGDEF)-like protein
MKSKTILVVDDTIANLDILVGLLSEYDVIDTASGREALDIVKEEKVDLILLDIMMPDIDGYEVCQKLKSNANTKDIPVIFITAKTDEESIEKAYSIGGSDYVTKPFRPKELLARVKRELQLKSYQEELKMLASIDPMTKLYNRRYFNEIAKNILEGERRNGCELSLMILDIDKFKNINDTYGHNIGDDVIIFVSDILRNNQRESDVICRYGGEEFVILLPETSLENAVFVAEKIRKRIAKSMVRVGGEESFSVSISIGVSKIDVLNESNIEAALKRADNALYEAKNLGRNRGCKRDAKG